MAARSRVFELRLHTAAGLPPQGAAVVAEIDLGEGVTWTSAPAVGHGGVAYLGAWVAVQPLSEDGAISVRITDRTHTGTCSSGVINAVGTFRLPAAPGKQAGGPSSAAAAAGSAASAAAGGSDAAGGQQAAADGGAGKDGQAEAAEEEGGGWTHVTLALEEGKTSRLAKAMEGAVTQAADPAGEQWARGGRQPPSGAAVEQQQQPGAALEAGGASAEGAAGAAAGAAAGEAPAAAAASGDVVIDVPPAEPAAEAASGKAAAAAAGADGGPSDQQAAPAEPPAMPQGSSASASFGAEEQGPQATTLRLSYRPLHKPASARHVAEATVPVARHKPTLLRLLSRPRRHVKEVKEMMHTEHAADAGGRQAAAAEAVAAAGAAGSAGSSAVHLDVEEVAGQLHLEIPLVPLPLHLHSYGHGAFMGAALSMMVSQAWRDILKREDPEAFKKAAKLISGMKLLASSHAAKGVTRAALAVMPALENNPVLAAYGAVRSGSTRLVAGSTSGASGAALQADSQPTAALPAIPEAPPASPAALAASQEASSSSGGGDGAVPAAETPAALVPPSEQLMAADAPAPASSTDGPSLVAAANGGMPGEQAFPRQPAAAASPRQPAAPASPDRQLKADGKRAAADARLAAYLESLRRPNRYGYLPIAQEWDIWVHPTAVTDLRAAGISHGSAGALVKQAVTSAMPCTRGCARSAGQSQITGQSASPVDWLNAFGHAINAAANGDRSLPLPLAGEPEQWWRLRVTISGGTGVAADRWFKPYVKARLESRAVVLPKAKSGRGEAQGPDGVTWAGAKPFKKKKKGSAPNGGIAGEASGSELCFWPLPLGLGSGERLSVELRGDPAGIVSDRQIGKAVLPLAAVAGSHPQLLQGEAVEVSVALATLQQQKHAARAAKKAGAAGAEGAANSDDEEEEVEEEEEEPEQVLSEEEENGGLSGELQLAQQAGSQADGSSSTSAAAGQAAATGAEAAADGAPAGGPTLQLTLRLEPVSCLEAAVAVGLTPAAAQTCLAMLGQPGGIYLDVKSAYSTPRDLQMFVSAMKGLGIHAKAVCSFQAKQLRIPRSLANTVLFFHGIGGLEQACDSGQVAPGQWVLFNGASFLCDLSPNGLLLTDDRAAELLDGCRQYPIDAMVVRRYKGLVEQYGFAGGIYVQEPDTSASACQALISLLVREERCFPLGFAYGHIRDAAVSVIDLAGRGFANQEILEELAARNAMSSQVVKSVRSGAHHGISANRTITWARRLVTTDKLMTVAEQKALLELLGPLPPGEGLLEVVDDLGGIPLICLRFFQHYEAWSLMTLLEAGFNVNFQKSFLRLMRNHGALAALPLHRKIALARFFIGPQLRGYGLTYVLMLLRVRMGLHKHAKEGMLCLLESCTADELDKILLALGGRQRLALRLRGRLRISWHYTRRLADVEATHATLGSQALAYENKALKYAALETGQGDLEEGGGAGRPANYRHTRNKTGKEQAIRAGRKVGCCLTSCVICDLLNIFTLGLFTPCCFCPRVLGATFKGTCSMGSLVAFILGLLAAICLYIFLFLIRDAALGA